MTVDRSGAALSAPAGGRVCLFGAALLLVLAGLVSMHGLGAHGVGGGANHAVTMTDLPIRQVVPAGQIEPLPDVDQGMSSGSGVCVAVLSLVTVLLLLKFSSRIRPQLQRPRQEPRRRSAAPRARAPDQPSLAALSILRC